MKTKIKRHGFIFSEEIDNLLRRLGKETKLKHCTIVEEALLAFSKIHDFKNGK